MNHNKIVNIFLLEIFVLFFMCSIVSAEDVYVGENSQYTAYLRTESIKAEVIIYQGKPVLENKFKFKTIWVPKEEELRNLKKLWLDDRIAFVEEDNKIDLNYNRITKEWLLAPSGVVRVKRNYKNEEKTILFHNNDSAFYSCAYVDK